MRLWHYKLIDVLPRQQLLGQWREINLIWKEIQTDGMIHHIIVDYINNESLYEFVSYATMVYEEMLKRKYKVNENLMYEISKGFNKSIINKHICMGPYKNYHDNRYLRQCYYNLQEKFDRGGIDLDEWWILQNKVYSLIQVDIEGTL